MKIRKFLVIFMENEQVLCCLRRGVTAKEVKEKEISKGVNVINILWLDYERTN